MKIHPGAYESPLYSDLSTANEEILRLRSKLIRQAEEIANLRENRATEHKSLKAQLRRYQRMAEGKNDKETI